MSGAVLTVAWWEMIQARRRVAPAVMGVPRKEDGVAGVTSAAASHRPSAMRR
jgi:hypothetical protein